MNKEKQQSDFWDDYSEDFDAIYSHEKSKFNNLLDKVFRQDMYERFQFTIEESQPISDRTILDVGCGPGYYSLAYARQGAKKVIGIDYSEKMIRLANERMKKENLGGNCQFLVEDIKDYNPDLKFDISVAIGLFDYIKDPLPYLIKMRELTNEKIILTFPRLYTWRVPIRKIRLMIKKLDVYFYSKGRLKILLESAGLKKYKIVDIGKLHCVVVFIDK
ncbi:MAG: class I SAM-dependent methyltransferase [Thermoplasmata archaeon]|nr:MAG: class I SAM-dependent methyltransferase [Thermoplasmata archaeon]